MDAQDRWDFCGCGFLDSRFRENDEELNHLNCNAAVSFASLAALCC